MISAFERRRPRVDGTVPGTTTGPAVADILSSARGRSGASLDLAISDLMRRHGLSRRRVVAIIRRAS